MKFRPPGIIFSISIYDEEDTFTFNTHEPCDPNYFLFLLLV